MSAPEDLASSALTETGLKPLQPTFQILIQALLFLGLLARSRITRFVIFIPILLTSVYMFFYTTGGKDSADVVTWTLIAATLFQASDALVINDVAKLRLVGQKRDTNELGLWERVKWAMQLLGSPRHVGWKHEPVWQFVTTRIVHCVGYYALSDVLHTYMCYSPAFRRDGVSIAEGGILVRLLNTGLHAAHIWAFVSLVYTIGAVVAVATYLTEASEWPATFGKWSDAYTVRRFWGRTWHQTFRRVLSTHGDFVAFTLLGLPKNTFIGTNVQRYAAFALSGLFHAAGEYGMFREKYWELSTAMTFFFLQATAILVEQEVGNLLGIKAGSGRGGRGMSGPFVGFLDAPAWVDPQFRYGFLEKDGFSGSVSNWAWKGEWKIQGP
ncbi:membrane bound O-acyl transferase family-domain-containing protein [Cyathus striatus]|nr:membrane bound O-acyl transferase family-domain-containing protein [Cyathus striatus]